MRVCARGQSHRLAPIHSAPTGSLFAAAAVFGAGCFLRLESGESRAGVTATGLKAAGICARSQSCWRQRNNWLA